MHIKLFNYSVMKLEVVNTRDLIPLKELNIKVDLYDFLGNVTTKLIFENPTDGTIEAIYKFTLDTTSVVYDFKVKVRDRNLIGVVREKFVAKKTYQKSVDNKQTSSLLEKNVNGNYTMSLGNLQRGDIITIEYSYLMRTNTENGKYKFVVPTNIGERYQPYDGYNYRGTQKNYSTSVDYKFHFDLKWRTGSVVKSCTSSTNSNATITKISDTEYNISSTSVPKDGDFVLVLESDLSNTVYMGQTNESLYSVVISKIPDEDEEMTPKEYVFFLDKSGSMSGQRIEQAKVTLTVFLKSLTKGSKFNVVFFDSLYKTMFENSVEYTDENVAKCLDYLKCVRSDGGTEMYKCLNATLNDNLPNHLAVSKEQVKEKVVKIPDHISVDKNSQDMMERIYVLLTDGKISDVDRVVKLVENFSNSTRFLTIGIGNDASRDLITRIAEASGGLHRMVIDEKSMDDIVIDMSTHIYKKHYKHVTVSFGTDTVKYPDKLYPNNYMTVFSKQESLQSENLIMNVKVSGVNCTTDESKSWEIQVDANNMVSVKFLELLYVNNLIQKGKLTTKEIVDLSVKYNIMNEHTSFLVVDEIVNVDQEKSITVEVPHYSRRDECERGPVMLCSVPDSSSMYKSAPPMVSYDMMDCCLESCSEYDENVSNLTTHIDSSKMKLDSLFLASKSKKGGSKESISTSYTGSSSSPSFSSSSPSFSRMLNSITLGVNNAFRSMGVNSTSMTKSTPSNPRYQTSPFGTNSSVPSQNTDLMTYQKTDGHFEMTQDSLQLLTNEFDLSKLDSFVATKGYDKLVVFNMMVSMSLTNKNKTSLTLIIKKLETWLISVTKWDKARLSLEINTVKAELSLATKLVA